MKQLFKKATSILLCLTVFVTCFASFGCNRGGEPGVNEDMLQLNVSIYDGGFGDEYAKSLKTRFEQEYADYVSPDGATTGVQVWVTPTKGCSGNSLAASSNSWTDDIYMPNNMSVYNALAKEGAFLDLTDIIKNQKLPGEEVTIWDKLNDSHKSWFEVDGKVYGVPLYENYQGIAYDVDLFDSKMLYICKASETSTDPYEKFSLGLDDDGKAEGPDGVAGTADDGLPKTYDEFFELCDYMTTISITPFLWAGKLQNYVSQTLMSSVYADASSDDDLNAFSRFTGKCDVVTGFDAQNNPIIEKDRVITMDNGYDVFRQPSRYYALDFLSRIISNSKYYVYNDVFGSVLDHLGAQEKYIYSAQETTRIAFLMEGTYWYNEAIGARQDFAEEFPNEANHRYGMLYLPKPKSGMEGPMRVLDSAGSAVFINGNIDPNKIDIAKKFFQFCFTNQSLSDFTRITSTTSPYEYTMTQAELDKTSYLGRQMFEIHNSGRGYYMPYNNTQMFIKNLVVMKESEFWSTGSEKVPSNYFKNAEWAGKTQNTPINYFNANAKYYLDMWNQMKI